MPARPVTRLLKTASQAMPLALLLPAAAQAACPMYSDLEIGIVLVTREEDNVLTEVFRSISPQLISYHMMNDGVAGYTELTGHGVHPMVTTDLYDGKVLSSVYSYDTPFPQIPEPAPGLEWQGSYDVVDADGSARGARQMTVGDYETISFGDCTYRALPVRFDIVEGDDDATHDVFLYLPEIAVSVLVSGGVGEESYDYQLPGEIRVLGDGASE